MGPNAPRCLADKLLDLEISRKHQKTGVSKAQADLSNQARGLPSANLSEARRAFMEKPTPGGPAFLDILNRSILQTSIRAEMGRNNAGGIVGISVSERKPQCDAHNATKRGFAFRPTIWYFVGFCLFLFRGQIAAVPGES